MLKIKLDNSISLIHRVKILLKKTEELHLELNGVKNAIDELDEGGFAQLKHLQVQNGHELLYVVSVVPSKTVFPRLEHLFSFSEYKKFLQLQEIEVIDCKNLKGIFGEESVDLVVENARNSKLEFTPLRSLVLQCLPQFISFGMKVVLPRLENLTLSSIKIEDIWLGQPQLVSSFQCLKILTVEECNGLKFLFSSSMVKSFMQLQKLVICKCKSMEAVILDSEGLEVQDKIIDMSFPKLFCLKLACLPKLTGFGTGNSAEFPTLNELHIESCSNLKTFFSDFSGVDMLREEPEEVSLEDYIIDVNPLFDKKVAFPSLEKMILSHLDNLQLIWHNKLHGDSFSKLKEVRVEFCKKLMTIVPSNSTQGLLTFHNLETLTVKRCWNMKSLFPVSIATGLLQLNELKIIACGLEEIVVAKEEVDGTLRFLFPELTFLKLDNLPKLEHFYMGLHAIEWPRLERLLVYKCKKMKVYASDGESQPPLFSFEKLGFRNLEHLKLSEFPTLEEKVGNSQVPIGLFCNLKSLVLDVFLGTLSAIPSSVLSAFKNLETLEVRSCGSLKKVFDMDTQQNADGHTLKKTNQEALDFNNLKSLKVYNCCNLRCIFTPSIISGLAQLQKIEVKNCALIEEIIMKEEEKEAHIEEIRIPQLNSIVLESLPNLTSFCLGINILECPALKAITVAKCPKIETFIFTDMKHQPAHIAPSFSKKVGFRKFEHLKLCEFVTLKENIWNGKVPIDLFCNLKSLVLDELSDIPSIVLSYFKNVEKIEVAFPSLEKMILLHLDNLQLIWHNQLHGDSFSKLKEVRVEFCEKLMTIVPSNSNQGLLTFHNLERLTVTKCWNMKSLFPVCIATGLLQLKELKIIACGLEEIVVAKEEIDGTPRFCFPQLTILNLINLPRLKHFYLGLHTIEWPMLKQLLVYGCGKIKVYALDGESQPALFSFEKVIPNLEVLGLNAYTITSRCLDCIPARSFRKLKFFGLVGFRKFEHLNLCEFLTLKENIWNGKLPIDLFCNLKSLVLDGLSDIATIIPSNVLSYFKNVETIEVKNYDSLKEVFDMEEQLDYGDGLSAKRSHHEILGFRNLKSLKVDNCNNLRYIFTASLASSLVQLEQIEIKSCALVEEIITKKGEKDAGIDKIKIPLLKSISLESLPNLTSFYSGSNILECPPLKNIIIKDCQNIHLKDFSLHLPSLFSENVVFPTMDDLTSSSIITEWIWQSQLPATSSCFEKLTILVIDGFDHLKYFFSSSMVKSLFELKELEISNCKLIEEIIVEDEERTSTMLFPKLYQLKLRDLPKLTTFCSSTGNFVELSSLFGLWIDNCPGMKSFVSISKWNDKTSTKKLEETNSNENLHAHMQSLFDKKVRLPCLERLVISHADEVEKIWDDQIDCSSIFLKMKRIFHSAIFIDVVLKFG
ncbi:hypothetical protein Patl1_06989 [Pistacia atlantica]|uniref:Uncharacterized protein n=1 Tax=Pistacia atlantica TaxID=434234 RepID=A0ACC1ALQ6_9ROSI|nr:hypothetical protein Patl1_06989 [Pistacia atlantica]